jgi:hypothetical protein
MILNLLKPRARKIPISFCWSYRFADMLELRLKKQRNIAIMMITVKMVETILSTWSKALFAELKKLS